jgi:glycosyltransferase involved in cell wall biosynthesis
MKKKLWINWETHRRSYELARALNIAYYSIDYEGSIYRYPISMIKTLFILIREKPGVLIVQNPSMILAAFACICRYIFNYFLIVDRHSTFRLNKPHSGSFRIWTFMKLHYFTIKYADLTIVTNTFLSTLVKKSGGVPFVLPDKLPEIENPGALDLTGANHNLLMISSFASDEPICEVFNAMERLADSYDIRLYISGNYRKGPPELLDNCPRNVVLTGFLSEQEFAAFLYSVDGILILTTSDYCLLCGCYEATAAEKPFITSKKTVLKEYFFDALHVKNTPEEIASAIVDLIENKEKYKIKIKRMRRILSKSWQERFNNFSNIVNAVR